MLVAFSRFLYGDVDTTSGCRWQQWTGW